MKLSKEALMMEQTQDFSRRQKWLPRIYAIMMLSFTGVYAVLMNYSEAVSEQWIGMTIGYSLMIGSFSFIYGMWLTFAYLFVEGKDGKSSQWIFSSVCYMPFSMDNWRKWAKKQAMCNIRKCSGFETLILAAGMFIKPSKDNRFGSKIYIPDDWFMSIMVCLIGTLLAFLCMYFGYQVLISSVIKKQKKMRVGGKGKKHSIT